MLVATVIVVAVLTVLVFILALIAFTSFLKAEKQAIAAGKRDEEIRFDLEKEKKKSSKFINIISNIVSGIVLFALVATTGTAIAYKASKQQFTINNHVGLVIVSDSMSDFYDEDYKIELLAHKQDAVDQQFQIGDILDFTKVSEEQELKIFDVYGYKTSKGRIITHRYIGNTPDGKYIFRGDNTGGRDSYVDRTQIILHYSGKKLDRVGLFVLFSQSGFGLYALISVIGVYTMADVFIVKYNKLIKRRASLLAKEEL